jgi:hypothetical protein
VPFSLSNAVPEVYILKTGIKMIVITTKMAIRNFIITK